MAITVRQVRVAAITSGGPTQDFVVSASAPGVAPKAAMITVVGATVTGTSTAGARLCVGVTDGTRQYCISSSSEGDFVSGVPTSNTHNLNSNTKAVTLLTVAGAVDAVATASFITNGVRLNWSDFPATAVFVTVMMWFETGGGTDLKAYAGNILASANVETNTTIDAASDPAFNFAAEQLIVLGNSDNSSWNALGGNSSLQLGFVDNGASIVQCSGSLYGQSFAATSQNYGLVSRLYASCDALASFAIAITAFSATGFTARTKIAGQVANYPYLALSYNGKCLHWCGVVSGPIVTGSPTESAPNFKPQFVLQNTGTVVPGTPGDLTDISRSTVGTGAGGFGISAFTATEMFSNSISDNDANTNMLTESMSSGGIDGAGVFRCRSSQNPPVDLQLAAFPSPQSDVFQPLGWKLTYSVAGVVARKWPSMAIGEYSAPSAGSIIPVVDHSYRQRRND